MTNAIAAILNISPVHQTFTFEGRSFDYYPAMEGAVEMLCTRWADGSRDVTSTTRDLEQALAVLLTHSFRRGVSAAERPTILERVRADLAA